MFHVISVKVGKEFLEPLVHNLVITPTVLDFVEENRPTLTRLFLEGGEDSVAEIGFNRFTMANVEIAGPVVR